MSSSSPTQARTSDDQGTDAADGDHDHHAMMVADFRRRFWISLILTIPVLLLAPMLQELVGLRETPRFTGDAYVSLGLSTVLFF